MGDPGSLRHDAVDGYISGADNVGGWGPLGRTGRDGVRFHHAAQNGMQFKTSELFISGIFHLTFPGLR